MASITLICFAVSSFSPYDSRCFCVAKQTGSFQIANLRFVLCNTNTIKHTKRQSVVREKTKQHKSKMLGTYYNLTSISMVNTRTHQSYFEILFTTMTIHIIICYICSWRFFLSFFSVSNSLNLTNWIKLETFSRIDFLLKFYHFFWCWFCTKDKIYRRICGRIWSHFHNKTKK